MYVQTTNYDRTFQSGFSELMGLFPPGTLQENERLSLDEENGLVDNSRGMPPINIRNSATINYSIGRDPIPNGFVSVPIFEFDNATMDDDIGLGGCEYVDKVDGYNFPADSTYTSVDWLLDDLREPIGEAFGLSQEEITNMDFLGLYDWCDVI